jgi:hypothetical protein
MRLGRRLATGVAEHPPAPEPGHLEQPAHRAAEDTVEVPAEPTPAELVAER